MTRSRPALELKGRMLPITRVRVLESDPAGVRPQLAEMVRQMPQAVKGMSVVIDSDVDTDLAALLAALREVGIQPLAVSEGPLAEAARAAGLPVVSRDSGKSSAAPPPAPAPAPPPRPVAPQPVAAQRKPARVVAEPIRSGQQIYADGCDLIVLNTVSPGAEVIADGCIHIYGKLAGRALAGVKGDESARVFCRKLDAELIAIAGIYAVAEQIKAGPKDAPAMAYLDDGRLKIEAHKI
ncbi:septum site-determining protein MinC [Nevskia sp.]|uniref:septum site-determining protein MinC n=1 Tax=Nevskia sp. TaxID=1929292 RepID=UPI0025EDDB5F|nr:septum site-determining protein MinC [Nevskia sp.]